MLYTWFSYFGPDQMMPLATPVAMGLGLVLMFGRYFLRKFGQFFLLIFGLFAAKSREEVSDAEPDIIPFPVAAVRPTRRAKSRSGRGEQPARRVA